MTPMVKLRCARSERAKKFGRYLNFCTAAKILFLVSCGIESATGARLMTSEMVAGERPRYSASCFRLTGLRPMRTAGFPEGPAFLAVTKRSLAQSASRSKRARRQVVITPCVMKSEHSVEGLELCEGRNLGLKHS